jgi:hypothetical protein
MSSSDSKFVECDVVLHLYDLSNGMAVALSEGLLGKKIEGIWHSGVVVYGYEYFYGGGITYSQPAATMAGAPLKRIHLGKTTKKPSEFHKWLRSVSSRFTPEQYSLLRHNCNNFADEAVQFLVGGGIPDYITGYAVVCIYVCVCVCMCSAV